jgi:streptogramin lyase
MRRSWLTAALGGATMVATAAAAAADTFPKTIQLPTGWRPEGIEAGKQHTLYVGSIPTGAVRQIDAQTGESFTLVDPTAGRSATGLEYDHKGERLFVSGGGTGSAFVYDARNGEPIADYLLNDDPAQRFINDNVLTKDSVYFTDSRQPHLYRLPLGQHGELPAASEVETIPLSGDYVHTPGVNNLNGIVATANEKWLIAVQSNTASLLRIDPTTGVADTIELTGGDATNGDGLMLEGQTLYVVQNRSNQVAVIHLGSDFSSGTVVDHLSDAAFRVPTTIDKAAGRLYLPNARFGVANPDTESYEVVALD